MIPKRKVDNLLALAVLAELTQRPMHRYELASVLRAHGKERDMNVRLSSLYTVVQNLAKHGFLEAVGTSRQGLRPERTTYRITEAGRQEMVEWTRALISEPRPEHHRFTAGLSIMMVLPPDEVIALLHIRLTRLEATIAAPPGGAGGEDAVRPAAVPFRGRVRPGDARGGSRLGPLALERALHRDTPRPRRVAGMAPHRHGAGGHRRARGDEPRRSQIE